MKYKSEIKPESYTIGTIFLGKIQDRMILEELTVKDWSPSKKHIRLKSETGVLSWYEF